MRIFLSIPHGYYDGYPASTWQLLSAVEVKMVEQFYLQVDNMINQINQEMLSARPVNYLMKSRLGW